MDVLVAIVAGWLTLAAVLTAAVARALHMRDRAADAASFKSMNAESPSRRSAERH